MKKKINALRKRELQPASPPEPSGFNHFLYGTARSLICLLLLSAANSHLVEAKTAAEVFQDISGSVVVVQNYDSNNKLQSMGSGIILPSGNVATNCHVIEKAGRLAIIYQKKEYPAKARYTDRFRDVCSLTVSGLQASQLILGDTNQLKVGSKVYAIGAPQGLELTFSDGIISGLRTVDKGHYIQSTAPISLGSSGGGLFDENARLIGLPTYFFKQGQQLNFALPVEWVIDLPNRQSVESKVNANDIDWTYQVTALEEKQDWGGMVQLCQRWTKQLPSSSNAWGYLGVAYLQKGDLTLAIEAYQAAVLIRPEYSQYWADLGAAYGREGQKLKKIEAYKKAVRLNNDYALGWINLANACVQNGEYEQAILAYLEVLRITPGDASSWYNMGHAYRDAGQFIKAVEAYRKAATLSPGNAQYLIKLGQAYGMAGQDVKQLEAYRKALVVNPAYVDAWLYLGVAYNKSKMEIQERDAYLKALLIDPNHNAVLFNLGQNYLEHGNRQKGMEVYSRLKELNQDLAQQFYNNFSKLMFFKTAMR
ncbi:tetratricopeptide repeat protein [Chlorobium sp. BLA1]|uniref:tetratricopeptide repeat-containing S1 family peptidase n=1 Tax=Candidatus Chlorobium masyuteum TaxID=2716876 RepID=UPI00142441DF|nr:tetratricopeptide repeat-containing serine protease family protein [Candidatus Chlorobium masyuteum]NHQ60368.1 tetratricopeptide repeat protein [Candidatus Chlorobium masyuteum]